MSKKYTYRGDVKSWQCPKSTQTREMSKVRNVQKKYTNMGNVKSRQCPKKYTNRGDVKSRQCPKKYTNRGNVKSWKCPKKVHKQGKCQKLTSTEKQQEKVQVCENNWLRRMVGVKTADKRRLDQLRVDSVEVGVKQSFEKKLARSRLKWAGHVERTGDDTTRKWRDIYARKTENVEGRLC